MTPLYPVFLKLEGLSVVIVGGGQVAASKLDGLLAAGAQVTVVAPAIRPEIRSRARTIDAAFAPAHLDGARWVIAAATPEVNREVAAAAAARGLFVNAVDDPSAATAYLGGVVRRGGVELAISTRGVAPALAGLLREALEAVLPDDVEKWVDVAMDARRDWKRAGVPMPERRPLLLRALERIYHRPDAAAVDVTATTGADRAAAVVDVTAGADRAPDVKAVANRESATDRANPAPDVKPVANREPAIDRADPAPDVKPVTAGCGGFVSIVGAGPGAADLLTVRAVQRLREADLVLYDALLDPSVLEYAAKAQRFYVGKRAGRHSIDQDGIHALMIRAAHRGARVVRLKCGDPFVLGRGGEEALALEAAGVAYEVVPGLSSATAAPELAGIPVTHRGLATGFTVLSGHAEAAFGPTLDSLAPGATTVVVLMGLRNRAEIARRMAQRGWPTDTPAAIVLGASHAGATRWLGTLGTLAEAAVNTEHAGVIVIGNVVRLADTIANEYESFGSELSGEALKLRSTGE